MRYEIGQKVLFDGYYPAIVVGYIDNDYEIHFPECLQNKNRKINQLVSEDLLSEVIDD